MDEQGITSPFKIPIRENSEKTPGLLSNEACFEDAGHAAEHGFAEIEIDFNAPALSATEKAIRFFSLVTAPEPIEQRASDPIREMFYDMRSLSTDKPFPKDDSELFYRQAKFMEDFTDNYNGNAKFFMYYPYYQHMGYEQLRTYFTWRTKARQGNMQKTSASYVYLYAYELINNIGVENPIKGFNKLIEVWETCNEFVPTLDNHMPRWLKDYHIYYGMPQSFTEFVKERDYYKYYTISFLFEACEDDSFELWNSVSGYDATKSRFYNDGNEQLFKKCFSSVLEGIRNLCNSKNSRIEDLFIYSISKKMPWRPFRHALYHNWYKQPDRIVEMPGQERFYCKNNQWTLNQPVFFSSQRNFIGYIMKKTEACLREAVKYKFKFKTEPDLRYHEYFAELKGLEGRRVDLDSAIEKAVAEFHWRMTRKVVSVDRDNLDRIRLEALGTQKKLIVAENEEEPVQRAQESKPENETSSRVGSMGLEQGGRISNEAADESIVAEHLGKVQETEAVNEPGNWECLRNELTEIERSVLYMVLRGEAGIKAYADENGFMLEVLIDSINEKAIDSMGDSILESGDGIFIYDEYVENVTALLNSRPTGEDYMTFTVGSEQ